MRDSRGVPFSTECQVIRAKDGMVHTVSQVIDLTGEIVLRDVQGSDGVQKAEGYFVLAPVPPDYQVEQILRRALEGPPLDEFAMYSLNKDLNQILRDTPVLSHRNIPEDRVVFMRRKIVFGKDGLEGEVGVQRQEDGTLTFYTSWDVCYSQENHRDPEFILSEILGWLRPELEAGT